MPDYSSYQGGQDARFFTTDIGGEIKKEGSLEKEPVKQPNLPAYENYVLLKLFISLQLLKTKPWPYYIFSQGWQFIMLFYHFWYFQ